MPGRLCCYINSVACCQKRNTTESWPILIKKKLPTALDLVSVLSFNPTHGLSSIKFGHSVIELTRTFGFRTLITLDRQGHGGNS